MTVEDAIHEELTAAVAVTGRVGARVYRGFRPQRSTSPCISFFRVSTTSINGATGPSGTNNIRLQVDSWAATPSAARELADAVRAVLAGWSNTASPDVSMCNLVSDFDMNEYPEPGEGTPEYRVTQDYSIWTSAS